LLSALLILQAKENEGQTATCPHDMIGLCELYLKNEVILACKEGK
jgi:hypothetical protein